MKRAPGRAPLIVTFALAFVLAPLNSGGCDDDAALKEFRAVAADGLSTGIQTALDAIVEGFFAVIEPDDSENGSSSSSSSTTTGSS